MTPLSSRPGPAASLSELRLRPHAFLGAQGLLNGRALRDASHQRSHAREGIEIDPSEARPADDREEIGVRRGEALAQEKGTAVCQLVFHEAQPLDNLRAGPYLRLRSVFRMKEPGAEHLVQFRGNEVQPNLKFEALPGSGGRYERRFGLEVAEVLQDRGTFRQKSAILELQRRNVALGIDRSEGNAAFRQVWRSPDVDPFERKRNARFCSDDLWSEGAGSGSVVEFHELAFRSGGFRETAVSTKGGDLAGPQCRSR